MVNLLIGLDSVALARESRRASEPEPATAAALAELAGADGITIGLRMDRRHGQERDLEVLRATVKTRLQVRIPPTAESLQVVMPNRPDAVVLVPERSDAIAHDSGFDLTMSGAAVSDAAASLREAGVDVMALIEPDLEQVKAAHRMGLHGASLVGARLGAARMVATATTELDSIARCVKLAGKLGLRVQVGHGLGLRAVEKLGGLPGLEAVEVGHAACARAMLVGFERAVTDFRTSLRSAGRR